ncbi:MAG TPA: hypothetical protein VMV08_00665 [Gaiellaceae bacterium]|nr:hypothetical protein [Gaiellaceae bacterium]
MDSWAILAWLDGDEPAMSRLNALLPSRPVLSWINLVEVYDRIERDHGRPAADEALAALKSTFAPDLPGTARMVEAFVSRRGHRLRSRIALHL